MRRAAIAAFVALSSVVSPLGASGQEVEIPKASEGYAITKGPSTSRKAPKGWEGTTDIATETAEGNTPATKGKTYVSHFTMSNEIRMCPQADGTVDGVGEFSLSVDYTGRPPAPAGSFHAEMVTKAKYKGMVGDDAMLIGPVTAENDYNYKVSGSGPGAPKASDVSQHLTTHFAVGRAMEAPRMDPFSGGDFDTGHLDGALGAATALTFWGGVYYSISMTEWLHPSRCVQVVFDPPSHSREPVLGSDVKVNAEIKTRAGEGVRGKFDEVKVNPGDGAIAITSSATDPGSPAIFTYTAPNTKVEMPGFKVIGTSRGGTVEAWWLTGLGTGWSGQINFSQVADGDAGHNELQTWSNSDAARMTVDVTDGVGTAYVYAEGQNIAINKQRALRGGAIVLIDDTQENIQKRGEAGGAAKLEVNLLPDNTYSLAVTFAPVNSGTMHTMDCIRENCTSTDRTFPVGSILPLIIGKMDDPNHLHGSQNSTTSNMGRSKKGKTVVTLTWDLERKGTTK
jgi:hypothetical protein